MKGKDAVLDERQALERMSARCAKSELCEADVARRLAEWGLDSAAAGRVAERLRADGFIDDARYCRAFVEDKWRFNRWGRMKMRTTLRLKGLRNELIDEALNTVVDDREYRAALAGLLREKSREAGGGSPYERYAKLVRFAQGRGFELDIIKDCLEFPGEQ